MHNWSGSHAKLGRDPVQQVRTTLGIQAIVLSHVNLVAFGISTLQRAQNQKTCLFQQGDGEVRERARFSHAWLNDFQGNAANLAL
jgi:hypothetical protein